MKPSKRIYSKRNFEQSKRQTTPRVTKSFWTDSTKKVFKKLIHLNTEEKLCAKGADVMLEQVTQTLRKFVILWLHVRVLDRLAEYVLVEGAREVALEQLVVVNRFCNDAPDELQTRMRRFKT